MEVVLAKGVDLFKYDSALDSYSENLKRTFDDIYENVFKPQFRKCGEEEETVSDEGEKSPKTSSKKKSSICPSKLPRANKKEDKENQPLGEKIKEKKTKKEVEVIGEKPNILVEQNDKNENILYQDTKVMTMSPTKTNKVLFEKLIEKVPQKETLSSEIKVEILKEEEQIIVQSNVIQEVAAISDIKIEPSPTFLLQNIYENSKDGDIKVEPSSKNQDVEAIEKTPLPMKVLAERKFEELPTEIKLKQLRAKESKVPEVEPEFKIPVTPSQTKEENKKKSSAVKLRNSMMSFMSPKIKNNVLKSPIVRRFSLQKSAMDCSQTLDEINQEIEKIDSITSKAVKTPLKVSFDLKEDIKTYKPVAPPRKEKRKSKANKSIITADVETKVEVLQEQRRPFIIPEIVITAPEEDVVEKQMEDIVLEEDAKHISHYYEFSDVPESDDEFFDCQDFDNTVVFHSLCPNKYS